MLEIDSMESATFSTSYALWRTGASTLQYEAEKDDEAFDVSI